MRYFLLLACYVSVAAAATDLVYSNYLRANFHPQAIATDAAGIEVKLASLRISPTLRYTRWGDPGMATEAHASPDQTQFLVSFTH